MDDVGRETQRVRRRKRERGKKTEREKIGEARRKKKRKFQMSGWDNIERKGKSLKERREEKV